MRHPPIVKDFPHFLHGGDYNPDQWQNSPQVWDEDFRLAKLSGCNALSVGIFSWTSLEPEEGRFTFDWLDRIMDRLAQHGMKAVLATPSGAKPHWMALKYPEIRRVDAQGRREPQQGRHNHCFTSPVYREKVQTINRGLAERYKDHPALAVWHLSNEYNGECRCDLCRNAFRQWLQRKYGTLDKLNAAWWTAFWSHTYTAWEQVDCIDTSVHGLWLDWMRFVSDQTADFIRCEIAPLRALTPRVPVTTNFMGVFFQLDYRRLARELDVISWDNYPAFHDRPNHLETAVAVSFAHDLNRSLKGGRPFMMMESSPSATNWMQVNRLLRPGVHRLKSLQAVAHGADTVQYFQYRKSRGGCEKFHGAVVDHVGHEHTRVFREVAEVGGMLAKLDDVVGMPTPAEAAIVFDWENRWILEAVNGPRQGIHEGFAHANYRPFWSRGVPVDVIGMDDDFSAYKLLIAPMLYMLRPGVAERLSDFVRRGGTLVASFLTGIADENDLCFLGGWPGPLRPLLGVWAEELDNLYDDESNRLVPVKGNGLKLAGDYKVGKICDLIHAEGAQVLATYGGDFYAGRPALTVNASGRGEAYYLATYPDERFMRDFYGALIEKLKLRRALAAELPQGVTAQPRADGRREYVFLLNFNRKLSRVNLGAVNFTDALTGKKVPRMVTLSGYGTMILKRGPQMKGGAPRGGRQGA